jgi:hypothetical protein
MTEDEVVRPVGTTDLHPDPRCRPVVLHPRGFLVAVLTDDEAGRAVRGLSGCRTLHVRYHGRHRRSDVVLQRPTS